MKILLIHQSYFPEMSGTARRTTELAESFASSGHSVTVFTSNPREFRSFPDYTFRYYEVINKVSVIRVNPIFQIKDNVLYRMLSYGLFVLFATFRLIGRVKRYDIIISIAPLSSGIIGAILRKIYRIHFHFDVPDMLPDLGIAAGMIKNNFLIHWLYKLEKKVYIIADTISACTPGQVKAITDKGIKKEKIFWIPDWIDEKYFSRNIKLFDTKVKKLYNYPGKKVISFVGNVGALQKPEIFIEVMKLFSKDGYHEYLLLFIGDGIMLPEMIRLVKKHQLNNVEFAGRVKREYIPSIMKLSSVLVTNYVPNDHLDLYIPGKLFEYAISEKPIVMGSKGDAKYFVEQYNLGIAVPPSDANSFKEAIIKVSTESYKYKPNTTQFTADYSIQNVIKLYNRVFENLL